MNEFTLLVADASISSMKVCQIDWTEYFNEEDKLAGDWALCNKYATFSHKDACEFIFWIGSDRAARLNRYSELAALGFSLNFLTAVKAAQARNFVYLTFYA